MEGKKGIEKWEKTGDDPFIPVKGDRTPRGKSENRKKSIKNQKESAF